MTSSANPAGPPAQPSSANSLSADLDHVLTCTAGLWSDLRGQRLFITGGTGFVGSWLLESFVRARDVLGIDAQALVLTRRPDAFRSHAPHLAFHPGVQLIEGDVRTFHFPAGGCGYVIHAAADPGRGPAPDARCMVDTMIDGTRRVLDFAGHCGARTFLFVSSGAVYGRQPAEMCHVAEDYTGAPSLADPGSAYGEAKRLGELVSVLAGTQFGFDVKIARAFALVGPYLPIDLGFAMGNFVRDALHGGPIRVTGDGTPRRSYLYAADLAIWLWTILFKGAPGRAYNVGSSRELSIADAARLVASAVNAHIIMGREPDETRAPERYVPDTRRAEQELGLRERVDLRESVTRTLAWHRRLEEMTTHRP